jgi:hypothetical protein
MNSAPTETKSVFGTALAFGLVLQEIHGSHFVGSRSSKHVQPQWISVQKLTTLELRLRLKIKTWLLPWLRRLKTVLAEIIEATSRTPSFCLRNGHPCRSKEFPFLGRIRRKYNHVYGLNSTWPLLTKTVRAEYPRNRVSDITPAHSQDER